MVALPDHAGRTAAVHDQAVETIALRGQERRIVALTDNLSVTVLEQKEA